MSDWLDDQDFYEACQTYRWSPFDGREAQLRGVSVTDNLEALKTMIRTKIAEAQLQAYAEGRKDQREEDYSGLDIDAIHRKT